MHSVYYRESEGTKISLRGDISLQVRHIPLPHWGEGGGRGSIQPPTLKHLTSKTCKNIK